mgnify:CR=1 FL=1
MNIKHEKSKIVYDLPLLPTKTSSIHVPYLSPIT